MSDARPHQGPAPAADDARRRETPPLQRLLVSAWFDLTRDEQRAVLVIGALLLVGIAARYWRAMLAAP